MRFAGPDVGTRVRVARVEQIFDSQVKYSRRTSFFSIDVFSIVALRASAR